MVQAVEAWAKLFERCENFSTPMDLQECPEYHQLCAQRDKALAKVGAETSCSPSGLRALIRAHAFLFHSEPCGAKFDDESTWDFDVHAQPLADQVLYRTMARVADAIG